MKIERIRQRMAEEEIDCFIVTKEENFIYSIEEAVSGYLFIFPGETELLLPRFYLYDLEGFEAEYFFTKEEIEEKMSAISDKVQGKVVTDAEKPSLLDEKFGAEYSGLMKDLRKIKTEKEVKKIKEACKITDSALKNLRNEIFEGVTEMEAQLQLKKFYSGKGVQESFLTNKGESLVQRNCLRPHRTSKQDKIQKDDLVIVDTGARKNFYCADVTRTYCHNPSERQQDLFDAVKKIQNEMIEMIEPGREIKEVVKRQMELTDELGYNSSKNVLYFSHGIGVEVHEQPTLSLSSEGEFEEGMTVTVEPGIHIQDLGGVRIEDTVHVTSSGAARLSEAPRKL